MEPTAFILAIGIFTSPGHLELKQVGDPFNTLQACANSAEYIMDFMENVDYATCLPFKVEDEGI